ncbi:hypothetical protein BGZ60DRAFT_546694 [Tricladium varicosporioides]|nr:hypothetical protein BGZ60DRAFT_546694 [Hymenoscyphus varicosporioides]
MEKVGSCTTKTVSSTWPFLSNLSDPYTFDLVHYTRLLEDNSDRVFVQDAQTYIKIIEIGKQDLLFRSFMELDSYLKSSQFKGIRIIFVPQTFSWGRLLISERGLRMLLSHFQVFPAFVDVITAFGGQTSSESDSFKCCYITKHVDEHGREDSDEPWSIRQIGVYHQRNSWLDTDTFIILNPSKSFQQRLKDAMTISGHLPTWRDIHTLSASCSATPWRRFIGDMESRLAQLKTKAHLSTVIDKTSDTRPSLKIEFTDTQDIQVIHDKLHRVNYILESNLRVFNVISRLMSPSLAVRSQQPSTQSPVCDSGLAFCTAETEMQIQRLQTLFRRIHAASGLMQNIIDFRGLEALKTNSEMSTEISRLAQSDNKLMLANAKKSQKDARTLTTITIFTMIYLPASFVSVGSKSSPNVIR